MCNRKAYEDGIIDWQKPISCHLYPIRITEYSEFSAINYHEWNICSDVCTLGKELGVKYTNLLKNHYRKYGEDFYNTLSEAAQEWEKESGNKNKTNPLKLVLSPLGKSHILLCGFSGEAFWRINRLYLYSLLQIIAPSSMPKGYEMGSRPTFLLFCLYHSVVYLSLHTLTTIFRQ